jgi:hypothetical protein
MEGKENGARLGRTEWVGESFPEVRIISTRFGIQISK